MHVTFIAFIKHQSVCLYHQFATKNLCSSLCPLHCHSHRQQLCLAAWPVWPLLTHQSSISCLCSDWASVYINHETHLDGYWIDVKGKLPPELTGTYYRYGLHLGSTTALLNFQALGFTSIMSESLEGSSGLHCSDGAIHLLVGMIVIDFHAYFLH